MNNFKFSCNAHAGVYLSICQAQQSQVLDSSTGQDCHVSANGNGIDPSTAASPTASLADCAPPVAASIAPGVTHACDQHCPSPSVVERLSIGCSVHLQFHRFWVVHLPVETTLPGVGSWVFGQSNLHQECRCHELSTPIPQSLNGCPFGTYVIPG